MAKIIILYEKPKDVEGFEHYYKNVHIPLVKDLPNVKNGLVNRVIKTQSFENNLYIIGEIEFETLDQLQEALSSTSGQILQNDLTNLFEFLPNPPTIYITK